MTSAESARESEGLGLGRGLWPESLGLSQGRQSPPMGGLLSQWGTVKLTDLKAYSAFCPLPKLLILHSNAARFRLQIPRILLNLTAPSPAFVREPEGTCCIERFFKTLKEQILWVRHFRSIRNWFTPLRSSALFTTDPG